MMPAVAPGSAGAGGVGAVGEMPVEDDALRRQGVEVRRRDPGVAVTADVSRLEATGRENEDFHVSRFYGPRGAAASRLA